MSLAPSIGSAQASLSMAPTTDASALGAHAGGGFVDVAAVHHDGADIHALLPTTAHCRGPNRDATVCGVRRHAKQRHHRYRRRRFALSRYQVTWPSRVAAVTRRSGSARPPA
jgi:hypothetical protein